jgi:hypothetical protein
MVVTHRAQLSFFCTTVSFPLIYECMTSNSSSNEIDAKFTNPVEISSEYFKIWLV